MNKRATCPAGHTIDHHNETHDKVCFSFPPEVCQTCPLRPRCCTGKGGRRICVGQTYPLLQQVRQRQKTEAFKQDYYKHRSGVEGCLSALARGNGLRVSCYISHPKRNLQALFGGSAANLKRVARWLAGIRRDGYIGWIDHEIMRLGLEENVCWLGPLSALDIVEELRKSSAMVLPTFVESYCVALAEAMIVGVPSAVSYTGGTSFLAKDGESALFFPPGDAAMCAFQLERLITDSHLAEQISDHARESALLRHNVGQIAGQQLLTYQKILETSIKVDPS